MTCQLVFLAALAIAVVTIAVLRQYLVRRGYRQAGDVFVSIIGIILPHSIGMGNLFDCAVFVIGIAVVHAIGYSGGQLAVRRILIDITQVSGFTLDKATIDIPCIFIGYVVTVLEF